MNLQTCVPEIFAHVDGSGAEGLMCADPGARTPNDVSGNLTNKPSVAHTLLPGAMVSSAKHQTERPVHTPRPGTPGKQLICADDRVSTFVQHFDKIADLGKVECMSGNLAELDTASNILYGKKHSRQTCAQMPGLSGGRRSLGRVTRNHNVRGPRSSGNR